MACLCSCPHWPFSDHVVGRWLLDLRLRWMSACHGSPCIEHGHRLVLRRPHRCAGALLRRRHRSCSASAGRSQLCRRAPSRPWRSEQPGSAWASPCRRRRRYRPLRCLRRHSSCCEGMSAPLQFFAGLFQFWSGRLTTSTPRLHCEEQMVADALQGLAVSKKCPRSACICRHAGPTRL